MNKVAFSYTRRNFLKNTSIVTFGLSILPRHVLGRGYLAPSDCLNVAVCGYGTRGQENIKYALSNGSRVVAVFDPDVQKLNEAKTRFPKAHCFSHANKIKDIADDIDAIVIASPDYTHSSLAQLGMSIDKHILCEIPLAKENLEFTNLMNKAGTNSKIIQSGFFGLSSSYEKIITDLVETGQLGQVYNIHVWNNNLDLDYCNTKATWHHNINEGTGQLGLTGFDILRLPITLLKVKQVTNVSGSVGNLWKHKNNFEIDQFRYPQSCLLNFRIKARNNLCPLDIYWYEGVTPKLPNIFLKTDGLKNSTSGIFWEGTKARLLCASDGKPIALFSKSKFHKFNTSCCDRKQDIENHIKNWVGSCKRGNYINREYDYSAVRSINSFILQGDKFLIEKGHNANSTFSNS